MRFVFLLAGLLSAPALSAQPIPVILVPPDPVADGRFGKTLANVPDADGDGHEDMVIAAADDNVPGARKAYLFSGATGTLLHTFDPPDPTLRFGYPVSGVPDTDGDGHGDLLIGAIDETGPTVSGRAYLYSGATGSLLHTLESPDADFGNSVFGYALAGVPDADGDGRGDLLVGSSFSHPASRQVAYLFSGATGTLIHRIQDPADDPSGLFAYLNIASVSDVDGDGRGDLVLPDFSANGHNGAVYVFSGSSGNLLHTLTPPNTEEISLFGSATSGLPDLDGDGRGDIFVGDFNKDGEFVNEGRGYVYSGATGELLHSLGSPTPEVNGHFGRSGAGLSDIDGDGVPDLVIGSWSERGEGEPRGRIHLFSGASGTHLRSFSSPDDESSDSAFGVAVAGISDENGDGQLLVGAPREVESSGRAYLFSNLAATPIEPNTAPPVALALRPPHPNPFRSQTTLALDVPTATRALVAVYDVLGRLVAVLLDGTTEAGSHTLTLDAAGLPSGIYLIRATVGASVQTRQVSLIR